MAELTPKTIAELPQAGTHTGTEILPISQGGAAKRTTIADLVYPVGSIYMSVNNANPATLFGGTWQQIQDTFLLAAGSTYSAGLTGGEAEHTITEEEAPATHMTLFTTNNTGDIANPGEMLKLPENYGATNNGVGYTSINFDSSGGGQPMPIMPPYLAVYVWKRTA